MYQQLISFIVLLGSLLATKSVFAYDTSSRPSSKAPFYLTSTDGTVKDLGSGLIWMRCCLGQTWTGNWCDGEPFDQLNYQQMVAAAKATRFAGAGDWRIPTMGELQRLRGILGDKSKHMEVFPGAPSGFFQSSSFNERRFNGKHYVFPFGYDFNQATTLIRLVRSPK
jgi:hypothetical protein